MAVSPWAQLEQQANTAQNLQPPPGVFATPEMTGPPPDMPQQQTPQIARIPTAGEQQIAADQGQLQKVRWNQAHPWGTPENHPGKLGKVAHVFSEIGNIAGDVFAPGVMANIPQTQMGMKANEIGLTNRLNKEIGDESLNQERAATQAETEEKTREAPGKAKSEEDLQGAQTENLENPNLQHIETDQGIFALNPKTHELTPLTYQGKPLNPAVKPGAQKGLEHVSVVGPNGKPMEANFHPDTGKYTDSAGKEIENPQPYEKPNQGGMVTVIAPDPNNPGGGIVQRLGAGAHLAPGSETASQYGAGNAADVKETKADTKAAKAASDDYRLMQTLATHPSPTNDLAMVMHYIGATKPDSLGKLRLNQNEINLVMGTRSSFGDLEALGQKIQNGQKLTPDQRQNMLATMKILADSHNAGGEQAGGPAIGTVEGGYRFKGGDAGQQSSWEKVK